VTTKKDFVVRGVQRGSPSSAPKGHYSFALEQPEKDPKKTPSYGQLRGALNHIRHEIARVYSENKQLRDSLVRVTGAKTIDEAHALAERALKETPR
jgi:hypothetical protein